MDAPVHKRNNKLQAERDADGERIKLPFQKTLFLNHSSVKSNQKVCLHQQKNTQISALRAVGSVPAETSKENRREWMFNRTRGFRTVNTIGLRRVMLIINTPLCVVSLFVRNPFPKPCFPVRVCAVESTWESWPV